MSGDKRYLAGEKIGFRFRYASIGMSESTTDFGFKQVPTEEKVGLVREVFDSVAENYDLMNDLMSLGVHRLWKDTFINAMGPRPNMHLLDVAGGTGDITFRFLERGGGRATICDINQSMLTVGKERAAKRAGADKISWVCGNAEALPAEDCSVDVYSIAFGLRNVTNIDNALKEARRVLKPGGRFMCLEFSRLALPFLDPVYDYYSFNILPEIGARVANDRESYVYLAESIRQFPPQDELVERIHQAGFSNAGYRNLSGGIAAIHSAWRI